MSSEILSSESTTAMPTQPASSRIELRTERLTPDLEHENPALFAQWLQLFHDDRSGLGVQHPQLVQIDRGFATKNSRLPATLLAARQNDALIAMGMLLPKVVSTAKTTGMKFGWNMHGYRLVGNRFLAKSESIEEQTELLQAAMTHVRTARAAFLMIEDIDEQSALAAAVRHCVEQGCRQFISHEFQPRLRIQLPATADEYWAKFSSKTRNTFRRKLKKIGENRLIRVTRPEQVDDFLKQAHAISIHTWQTRHFGLRVRNDERERAMFRALAEQGVLRSYLWMVGDTPAAFLIGNQAHGAYQYEEVGYLPEFARNSPGQMLLLQVLDDLFTENRPDLFDFGGGDADYKRMFANSESRSGTVWLVPNSLTMRATMAYLDTCLSMKRAVRDSIRKYGLATKVRQWIRYGRGANDANAATPESSENAGEKPVEASTATSEGEA